jgi:glutamine synthetase
MSFIVEYIWIDAQDKLRSKIKVYQKEPTCLKDMHKWNFDGSSTGQAQTIDSERFLKPVYMCKRPFYNGGFLVLCAVYDDFDLTIPSLKNNYEECNRILSNKLEENPWFGFEQEYFILKRENTNISKVPLGVEHISETNEQGQYYCSVGSENAFGREVSDKHLECCLAAGLSIYGTNAEVAPSQWEYQIGTIEGIDAAHQLWVSRYILLRIAEEFDVCIDFYPKPFETINGSGCHTNFSTVKTRSKEGFEYMKNEIFPRLERAHQEHISNYGSDNHKRLTGIHETANINKFSWGISSRGDSIRVGLETFKNGFGYFEDRRPASNCDPYLVCMLLVKNSC